MERYNFRNIERKWRDKDFFTSVQNINSNKKTIHSSLSAGSIGTYIWNFKN